MGGKSKGRGGGEDCRAGEGRGQGVGVVVEVGQDAGCPWGLSPQAQLKAFPYSSQKPPAYPSQRWTPPLNILSLGELSARTPDLACANFSLRRTKHLSLGEGPDLSSL